MSDAKGDKLEYVVPLAVALVAGLGAMLVAYLSLDTGIRSPSPRPAELVAGTTPTAMITSPSPRSTADLRTTALSITGTWQHLPTGWTLWLFHAAPGEGHVLVGSAPLDLAGDGTWSTIDGPFDDLTDGDQVTYELLVAPPPCTDAVRALEVNRRGERTVPSMPSGCPAPAATVTTVVATPP